MGFVARTEHQCDSVKSINVNVNLPFTNQTHANMLYTQLLLFYNFNWS